MRVGNYMLVICIVVFDKVSKPLHIDIVTSVCGNLLCLLVLECNKTVTHDGKINV